MESLSLRSLPFPRYSLHSLPFRSLSFSLSIFWIPIFFLISKFPFFLICFRRCCSRCCYRLSASETGTNPRWVPFKSSNFPSKPPTLSRILCLRAQSSGGVGDGDAVIIVDHGSRRKESNLLLSKLFSAVIVS